MSGPAFEHNGTHVERSRFYALACDPQRSVAVEACAGSGKTWMLVSRMVRALLEGCAPHEILAITFTKKAAAEMRQRLQDVLHQFAGQDDDALRHELRARGLPHEPTAAQLATLRGLHHTLLRGGRMVQVRTFHSWFATLLRSAPLQALADLGLPESYELLENDAKAVAEVWPRFLATVASDPTARADYMEAVATHGRHQTHKALEAALAKRVEFALADAQGVVDASVQTFGQRYPQFAQLSADMSTPSAAFTLPHNRSLLLDAARLLGAATQATLTKAAVALEAAVSGQDWPGVVQALLTQSGSPRKFSDKAAGIDTIRQAQDWVVQVQAAEHQHQAWLHQQRMARLTRVVVAQYAALKRERGWLDMNDLERAALALMTDPVLSGWVQERLDARVRHLLIDEFQDTNPLQWQALSAWLAGYAGVGHAPSVFVVGDPKQSIYRFRRAEPQVFKAAQRFVVDALGGDLLSCDHTWRNAPVITALVNTVMLQAQDAQEFDAYRTHSTESQVQGHILRLPRIARGSADEASEETEGDDLEAEAQWRNSLTTPRRVVEETLKTQECRQAAQWLAEQLHTTGLQPKDVMVLSRKRERLSLMQAALAALHIPAQQPEKTELGDMPEVQDLVALLDVLVSPAHNLSLAQVLKSPLFGVDDAALVQLVLCLRRLRAALPAEAAALLNWWHVLQQATDLPAALAPVGAVLAQWKQWVSTLPPHDALGAIYQHGDVLARYAAATPAHQREGVLTNLRALQAAALQVDGGRYTTAYALVRALRAGGIAAPVRADADAMRLLTVHGSKGLEAPLVLMLDTDSPRAKSETMGVLVDWPGEAAHPQRFVFLASESAPPACVADMLAVEQTARRREELNTLYVALTRARHTLVLSSTEPRHANTGSWWQRLEAHASDAPVAETPVGGLATADTQAPYTLVSLPKNEFSHNIGASWGASGAEVAVVESVESRMGQAMHRLLERLPVRPASLDTRPAALWSAEQCEAVAVEFALEPAPMARAVDMAQAIVQGEGAWAWDSRELLWHGNEVALVWEGRLLRIDRLVQRCAVEAGATEAGGQWWVLDYKSSAQPQQQPELRAQLWTYRAAVMQAYPGHTVRAAFLTPQGTLIELNNP